MRYQSSSLFAAIPDLLTAPFARFRAERKRRRLEIELSTLPDYLIRDMGLSSLASQQFKNLDS